MFCLGIQIFMAFNAGATTGSIDIIQSTPPKWDDADIGILAAMDKVGMTISSPIWGYLLQTWEPKVLLVIGLAMNACGTLLFALLTQHPVMLLAKLLMGFTEGLQWVWSQIWIVKHAGGYPLFLNLNGVSAGAGTMLGTAVSGFTTAHGMSYGFAFTVEGIALLAFWLALLFVPRSRLRLKDEEEVTNDAGSPSSHRLRDVLKMLGNRPLYLYTAFAFAFDTFIQTGCQFLWIRIFTVVWQTSKDHATSTLLLVPTIGSALGAAAGSTWKFNTPDLIVSTLWKCVLAASISVIGAGLTLFFIFVEMQRDVLSVPWWLSLTLAYMGFALVYAGVVANMGAVVGICTDAIEDRSARGIAVGLQQALNNGFGLTLSPLVPQMAMSVAHAGLHIPYNQDTPVVYFCGAATALCGTGVIFLCCLRAWLHCRSRLPQQTCFLDPPQISLTA